jgi:hypothetical protein
MLLRANAIAAMPEATSTPRQNGGTVRVRADRTGGAEQLAQRIHRRAGRRPHARGASGTSGCPRSAASSLARSSFISRLRK